MNPVLAVAFCLVGSVLGQRGDAGRSLTFSHQWVEDWTKVLTNPELYALISQRDVQWPTYDTIPPPSFDCQSKIFPGFYADPATQCQTFHRCDINGNLTSYICVNRTVFNPITLVCDQWFNVDCANFVKDEYFGNRRLYTTQVLFDTKGLQAASYPVTVDDYVLLTQGSSNAVKQSVLNQLLSIFKQVIGGNSNLNIKKVQEADASDGSIQLFFKISGTSDQAFSVPETLTTFHQQVEGANINGIIPDPRDQQQ